MSYTTVDDVQKLAPHLPVFSPSSKPSYAQVEAFIADIEAVLNASLAATGYPDPLTDPGAIVIVKDMVAHAVLARVFMARAAGTNSPGDLAAADRAQKYFDGRLKAILSPSDPFVLPGEVATGAAVEKDRVDIVGVGASTSRHADYPVLTRDMVF